MCGIVGAIGAITSELRQSIALANAAQLHRGPDDSGVWHSGSPGGSGASFAFRRLAILDVSANGHQPMVDATSGNCIVFNGEIYNFRELRGELESQGARFTSTSDTEVVLQAYARWGSAAIRRLRGMFALAIWDARTGTVLVARDRLGIKPLYVTTVTRDGRRSLLFASELRSLLATGLVERRIDRTALDSYLWNGFVIGPGSIVAGISLMPPGTIATVDPRAAEWRPEPYWSLSATPPAAAGSATPVEELAAELRTATAQHLVSDVPLGVFLSGGIDSSAVAALAAGAASDGPRSLRTFNISFDEAEYDESRYAKAVAAALGTDHRDIRLTEQHFVANIDRALTAIDQPTFDGINNWFVSRAVRDAGMTVALAGTGGDELFGGYRSFDEIPRSARASRLCKWLPKRPLRAMAHGFARLRMGRAGAVPPQTRWGKLADLLGGGGDLLHAYQTHYAMFSAEMHAALQGGAAVGHGLGIPAARAAELSAMIAGPRPRAAVALLELANFIGERLLRDTDWSSMAVSLEVRVPLLDHRVVEAASRVDDSRRFDPVGKKRLLRELALGGIDPTIFDRPKSGFVLPLDLWCRQRLKDQVGATLTDTGACARVGLDPVVVGNLWRAFLERAPGIYWSRIWTVFVLLNWCQRHRLTV